MCSCARESERETDMKKAERWRQGLYFSIDNTDFTHQAPNCLNILNEDPI